MHRDMQTMATGVACACLALGLLACSPEAAPVADSVAEPPRQAQYTPALAQRALVPAGRIATHVLDFGVSSWFHTYSTSRVIEIPLPEREPQAFGPWTAEADFGTTDARDDGSLTEWDVHYYITHDWSEYGKQILSMTIGDSVSVNDMTVQVEGVFEYPKDSYYNEVMEVTGKDAIVFQTCVPNSDTNRIVYGRT